MKIDLTLVAEILLPGMDIFSFQNDSAFYVLCTCALIVISTVYVFFRKITTSKQSVTESDWSSLFDDTKAEQQGISTKFQAKSAELKNVFDVKQTAPRIQQTSLRNESDKPFKSSYYYAHNNPNTTGGYKDGLKAEDYVMNGPRLLKKTTTLKQTSNITTSTQVQASVKNGSIPIKRYMWDDDGNGDGIAKIIIDSLPSCHSRLTFMRWEESGVISKEDVKSKLVGEWQNGLVIQIRQKNHQVDFRRYHLHVPRLFGEVSEVKLVVKKKKLIVKLYKKKDKENMRAWPQLPSKVTSSPDNSNFEENLFDDHSK